MLHFAQGNSRSADKWAMLWRCIAAPQHCILVQACLVALFHLLPQPLLVKPCCPRPCSSARTCHPVSELTLPSPRHPHLAVQLRRTSA